VSRETDWRIDLPAMIGLDSWFALSAGLHYNLDLTFEEGAQE